MENFKDYIEENKTWVKSLSDKTYGNDNQKSPYGYVYRDTNVYFSFDYGNIISEICFARLYKQMAGKKISSNYWLKLPYDRDDTKDDLDNIYLNYSSILNEMKEIVSGVFNMEIHKTGYKNIKLITFSENKNLIKDIDYSLTLILFCLLRGMDSEYHSIWKNSDTSKDNLPDTLSKYLYEYSIRTSGSDGHDINDTIANLFNKRCKITDLREKFVDKFFTTLKLAFGKNGYINNNNFKTYFQEIFENVGKYGNYAMQTTCFDYIEKVVNRITLEEKL